MVSVRSILFSTAALLFTATHAYADESFEVCTPDGPCALRVTDTDTQNPVWLVTEASADLKLIWDGTFWLVSNEDYEAVRELVPERVLLPAVDPSTGVTLQEKQSGKGTTTSTPSSGGTSSGGGTPSGGLISVGNITIGGGGSSCGDCHKGNMREIHKKVLPSDK